METKFYTIDEVASILDIHHKTVRKFIKEGNLKANKVGKQWRISQLDLDEFTGEKNSAIESQSFNSDEEIGISNENTKKNKVKEINVSSVISLDGIDKEVYFKLSNTLLAIMNSRDERLHGSNISIKYSENLNVVRIMLWADIELTKEILDVISMIVNQESIEEDNNEL